jgi:hypothetical protein
MIAAVGITNAFSFWLTPRADCRVDRLVACATRSANTSQAAITSLFNNLRAARASRELGTETMVMPGLRRLVTASVREALNANFFSFI